MKRILEVLQDGDGQLKFRTDINVWKDPMASMDIIQNAMLSMLFSTAAFRQDI